MTAKEMLSQLKLFTTKGGLNNNTLLHIKSSNLLNIILKETSFLNTSATLAERIYNIMNNITALQQCNSCHSSVSFRYYAHGYSKYCSSKCGNNSSSHKASAKSTNLAKYGVEYPSALPEFINKAQQTNLNKYKVTSKQKLQSNIAQVKQTKLQRHGDANYNNKEQTKATNLTRYGSHLTQAHFNDGVLNKLQSKSWLLNEHITNTKSLEQIATELDVDNTTIGNYLRKANIEIQAYNYSYPEQSIAEYVKSLYDTTIIRNTKNIIPPREIDIYLPEFHLAIEFNGTYWHRPEIYGGYNEWLEYHQSKIDLCAKKGIALLHLWDGLDNHNDLIESAVNGFITNDLKSDYNRLFG